MNREWCGSGKTLKLWLDSSRAYTDCRISAFPYLGRLGDSNMGDADPSTVVVDKIPVDADTVYGWEVMKVLNELLCREGITHRINYSGRFRMYACVPRAIGFHIYPFSDPNMKFPKQALANCQSFLAKYAIAQVKDKYGLIEDTPIDPATVGDVMRMMRYTNTYNKKWGRWCVPLTQDEIDKLDPFEIYKLGGKPRKLGDNEWLGGDKVWKIPANFDKQEFDKLKKSDVEVPVSDVEFEQWFDAYAVSPCVRKMAKNPFLDYQERFWFIVSLRDIGFSEGEIDQILQKSLDYSKYTHCVEEEDMIARVFRGRQKNAYFKGGCQFMKSRSFCDGECGKDHPVYR
jgi:hypothetical protein